MSSPASTPDLPEVTLNLPAPAGPFPNLSALPFETRIVEFCRFARAHGLNSGIDGTIASLRAARVVGRSGFDSFKFALRAALCATKEEWDLFDPLFDSFWRGQQIDRSAPPNRPKENRPVHAPSSKAAFLMIGDLAFKEPKQIEEERKVVSGANPMDRLGKVDFSQVPQEDLAELERLSERLLRRMSFRLSRRLKPQRSRGRVDLRRSIRAGIPRGGELVDLRYRGRRRQAAKLVILLDVSDSMNPYSLFLFKFAYALGRHFDRLSCFVFSTRIVDVRTVLKAKDLPGALKALSKITTSWFGGTKIGSSLREFNRSFGRLMRSTDTTVMILSDGWDTGEPDDLIAELKIIKRRVKRLIWLNPLLGLEEYEPVTRGMSAALPYIDLFAPAHNLLSLLELERNLRVT
jgi:uncharacterized protein